MSGTTQLRAARPLVLLALLLGLVAMHGLASTHHAAAAPVAAPAPDLHAQHAAPVALAPAGPALSGPALSGSTCDDDCLATVGVLCVAVLTAAVALTLLARRTARRPHLVRPSHLPRGPSAAWRPPGPDPVAELCVSRT